MNPPSAPQEPLNNVELESAILAMKMALTPEEEAETRQKFLELLSVSMLVIPTVNPVKTNPDGSIAEKADITFVVVENQEKVSGIPAFTSLGFMRASLPNVNNGLFLNGAQLAGIVGPSPHKLFVDGPDIHAEVEKDELATLDQTAKQAMAAQQAAANRNEPLEKALAELASSDTPEAREAVKAAFQDGFCRMPVARDPSEAEQCLVIRSGNPQDPSTQQQIPLMTQNGELLCFSSDEEMRKWKDVDRQAIALPGPMICDMVVQSGIGKLRINLASADARSVQLEPPNRFTVL